MKGKRIISALLTLVLVLNLALVADVDAKAADSEPVTKFERVSGECTELSLDAPVLNSPAAGEAEVDHGEFEIAGGGTLNSMGELTMSPQQLSAVRPYMSMTATSMYDSTKVEPDYTVETLEARTYMIIKIKAGTTGNMYLDYAVSDFYSYDDDEIVTFELLTKTNAEKFEKLMKTGRGSYSVKKNSGRYASGGEYEDNVGPVSATGGTSYYLAIANYSYEDVTVGFASKVYSTGTRTLYAGNDKWTYASGINSEGYEKDYTWFKIKPTKSGLMTVFVDEFNAYGTSAKVTLYNKSKKRVSDYMAYDSTIKDYAVFGVKKGYTYYLKVSNAVGPAEECYRYGVAYVIDPATDYSRSSKSKAKTLTMGGAGASSLFGASTSTSSDYYKVKLSYAQPLAFAINKEWIQTGTVTVRAYRGSSYIGKAVLSANDPGDTFTIKSIGAGIPTGCAAKGTYYFKITKSTKASGVYGVAAGNY